MIKLIFLIFSLICSFTFAPCQTSDNATLWRISGNGLAAPSYLFGTIHAVPEKEFQFSDTLLKYFGQTTALMIEADVDVPLKEQIAMVQQMMLPKGTTLQTLMDSTLYQQYFSYMRDSLGIKESKIERYNAFKPAFVSLFLLVEVIGTPVAYDLELEKKAKKTEKSLHFLETIAQQMAILDSIPLPDQLPENMEGWKIDKEYFELYSLYKDQNLTGIDSMMSSEASFQKMEPMILNKRNLTWLPKIENLIKRQPSFVAVGCGHLPGKDGLINLLRDRGYSVEPIRQ